MQYGILQFDDPQPDTSRKILHVDMDAFYASVEIRDQPHLKDKPVVIAKHPNLTNGRGIVTTCNYIARQYGIHSAMSSMEAYKRCPHAVFISGNMKHYQEVSNQIRAIFYQYTDLVEPLSLDEAYLDVTINKKGIKSATIIAQQIQQQILQELNLTCSIGISYNKFIAKIASDYHKPFGLTLVTPEEALMFLERLPIEKFYGVGRKSVPYFHDKGIKTGKDLANKSLEELERDFGKMGHSLFFKVRGIHNSPVRPTNERKSIGKETTFSQFLEFEPQVLEIFDQLTTKVIDKMQSKGLKAHTITIKIRYENFETINRQMQMKIAFDDRVLAYEMVQNLWAIHGHLDYRIRLLGVSVSNFDNPDYELIRLNLES
ncbi:DNA polymerase IV [Fundicoccus culcitae]|uniref:DNA polymerase IV n=1 Tax=Fundicoccus culcitae TaxID=2969821 RepID=A0ABY5P7F0_9LACT|nr:DNA polymerase IV [Fundicoccus culcitae]UUX34594.1 DNA polymerase IV [Fundicoccus culcitae]